MKFLSAHAAKILAALAVLEVVLQALGDDPTVKALGPGVAHAIAAALTIVTLLATLFKPGAALGAQGNSAATPKTPPAAFWWLLAGILTLTLPFLSGCAALRSALDTPSVEQTLIADAVTLLTDSILSVLPAGTRGQDAAAIVTGCTAVDAVAGGMSATASSAQATLQAALTSAGSKLSALQASSLASIASGLNAVMTNLAANNATVASYTLSVTELCSDISAGAAPFVGDGS